MGRRSAGDCTERLAKRARWESGVVEPIVHGEGEQSKQQVDVAMPSR